MPTNLRWDNSKKSRCALTDKFPTPTRYRPLHRILHNVDTELPGFPGIPTVPTKASRSHPGWPGTKIPKDRQSDLPRNSFRGVSSVQAWRLRLGAASGRRGAGISASPAKVREAARYDGQDPDDNEAGDDWK